MRVLALALVCCALLTALACGASARPFTKAECDSFLGPPRQLFSMYADKGANPGNHTPEFKRVLAELKTEYLKLHGNKKEACTKGTDLPKSWGARFRQLRETLTIINKPSFDRDIGATKKRIADHEKREANRLGGGSCSFSTCGFGKAKCCRLARAQLNECKANFAYNSSNYANYGAEGQAAAAAVKECIRCSQVWLSQNGC
ncbi:hypothetical protein GOB57_09270 [Sinorhizobium meliloti]|nr:hypothetical protein [Sinorhizobium meliloti]